MVNADVLEKAVLDEFFEALSTTKSMQEAVFCENPVEKVNEALMEKEKKLKARDRRIQNLTQAIEHYEGEAIRTFLNPLNHKSKL
jgi:hypothetical protein